MKRFLLIFLAVVCVLLDAHYGTSDCQLALFGLDDALVALVGSAIISGVGSAIASSSASSSAARSASSVFSAGVRQAEATEYSADKYLAGVNATNLMNARENQLNRQFQWDMWNATNEYNDPLNEVKRLLSAGLNPALVKAGQPASMQSAPSSIAMQAPQQTSVPDYVTPAVNAAQVEQGGMQQAYGLRMQAFEQVSSSLVNAFDMAHKTRQFGLEKRLGDQMLNVYDAQIKNLGAQTRLYNEQEWDLSSKRIMQRVNDTYQRLNDLQTRLESDSRIKVNDKTLQKLSWEMSVQWPKMMMLEMYNAKTGRMNATTAQATLNQHIREWNEHNIPGFSNLSPITQKTITRWIGQSTIQGMMSEYYGDRLDMYRDMKQIDLLNTWRDRGDNPWKDIFDLYVNPLTSNLPAIGTQQNSDFYGEGYTQKLKKGWKFKW